MRVNSWRMFPMFKIFWGPCVAALIYIVYVGVKQSCFEAQVSKERDEARAKQKDFARKKQLYNELVEQGKIPR